VYKRTIQTFTLKAALVGAGGNRWRRRRRRGGREIKKEKGKRKKTKHLSKVSPQFISIL
jgi:hypothetical protein